MKPGAHYPEPPSPMLTLWGNPFPYLSIFTKSSCRSSHDPFSITNDTRAKTIPCYNIDWDLLLTLYFAFSICINEIFRGKPRDPYANYSSRNRMIRESKGLTLRYSTYGGSGWWAPDEPDELKNSGTFSQRSGGVVCKWMYPESNFGLDSRCPYNKFLSYR